MDRSRLEEEVAELEACLERGHLAAREFSRALRAQWGRRVQSIRLYGSFARSDATEDSDLDLLILLDRLEPGDRDLAARLAFQTGTLKHDVVIVPLVFAQHHFERLVERERAFALAALREGIEL